MSLPPSLNYKDIRLPKGLLWPGELTAVVRLTPKTCNYNGQIDAGIGEQCDTAQLTEEAAAAQLQAVCTAPPSGGTPFVCDMRDCSCAYQQPGCQTQPNAQCWNDTQCPVGQSCTEGCVCGAAAPTLSNDCTVHVLGYSSNEMKEYVTTVLNKPLQEAAKRPDYEFYAEPEQRVAVICQADNVLTEDGGVLPGQLYQTGGSMLLDFIHNPGIAIPTIEEGKPVQLLSVGGAKTLSLGVGEVSADLGMAGAVPMASLDSAFTITAGTNSFDINNGMLQYEIHPATTTGQTFSISNGVAPLTVSSPAGGAFFVSYDVTRPLCPMFTQAGYFSEDCGVGPKTNYEKIRQQIEAIAAIGPVKSADFATLSADSVTQTYYYRFNQKQLTTAGKAMDLMAGLSNDVYLTPRAMSCGCNATALAPELGDILAALAAGLGFLAARRRMKKK